MQVKENFRANPSSTLSDGASELSWEKLRRTSASVPKFTPSSWVKLFNPPTAFSFDEAWLLCEASDTQWLAWIPDYGEILLDINEFCTLT